MDTLTLLMDFILHIDRYLEAFVQAYGVWIYAILFLVVFVETGLVVMPFLPGDSLLFVVGAMAGAELLSLPWVLGLLTAAAILGDQCNYFIGRHFGQRLLNANTRWFNRQAYDQAHAFYERYGSITIVLARFLPFIRTFAPFVAGVADMDRRRFTLFNFWVPLSGFGVFALQVICLATSDGSKRT